MLSVFGVICRSLVCFTPRRASVMEPFSTFAMIVPWGCGPLVTKSDSEVERACVPVCAFPSGAPRPPLGCWAPGGPNEPDAREADSFSWPSNWPYRCERSASVVTVPITAHTTAINVTDATTSRVRRVRGLPARFFCARGRRRPLMTRRA